MCRARGDALGGGGRDRGERRGAATGRGAGVPAGAAWARQQNWQNFASFCIFLAGSFSALSKRNLARKYAFDSIFKLYKIFILLHRCNLKILAKKSV